MGEKGNISQYRERLDKTLASSDLTNGETLGKLVKNQILRSSQCETEEYIDDIVETRTKEVSDLLDMLRSASENDVGRSKPSEAQHGSWKLKQDAEDIRVMYREGPKGTPFHTLLAEGYVDGPVDVCLCISWESSLYNKWWPQTKVPTFKIMSSDCLQKIRIGEQISSLRMKIPWPLSAREAIVHFFEFEYFQDDLIVVLFNTIPDLEKIDRRTHGFTSDGIPEAKDVVRIDVVGGFAMQKVTKDRSYFRTIANMDIKVDFLPPSFINFVSRQLIGSGFRLYQKEVASVTKGDPDFADALKEPLYARIRESLYSESVLVETLSSDKTEQIEVTNIDKNGIKNDNNDDEIRSEIEEIKSEESLFEIREIKVEEEEEEEEEENVYIEKKRGVTISPKVEQALGTLEKVISIVREYEFKNERLLQINENEAAKCSKEGDLILTGGGSDNLLRNEPRNSSGGHGARRTSSNSCSKEASLNKIAPASPEEKTRQIDLSSSPEHEIIISEKTEVMISDTNGFGNNNNNLTTKPKNRKHRFCCFSNVSG